MLAGNNEKSYTDCMITVQASDRRFWLLKTPGGLLRLGGVLIFGIVLMILGVWLYDNIWTAAIFGLCIAIIMFFISQRPKEFQLSLDDNQLIFLQKTILLSEIDSWTLIDLEEKAQLIFRLKSGGLIEAYADKAELTASGMINEFTQKIPFNPDLVSSNVVKMILRLLNLA